MKLRSQLRQLLRQVDDYIEKHIDTALSITRAIKNALSSPVADLLTAIIPGNVDDIIRRQLIGALDEAITALNVAGMCSHCTDIKEKIACFIRNIRQQDPHIQDAILQKLASLLTAHLDGQRLRQYIYDLYTQAGYSAAK